MGITLRFQKRDKGLFEVGFGEFHQGIALGLIVQDMVWSRLAMLLMVSKMSFSSGNLP